METVYLNGRKKSYLTDLPVKIIERLRKGDLVMEVKLNPQFQSEQIPGGMFVVEEISQEDKTGLQVPKIMFREIPCNAKKPDTSTYRYMWVSDVDECTLVCEFRAKCPFRRLLITQLP
jgi:hypothetical protein